MKQISKAVVDEVLTLTNHVVLELGLVGSDNASERARLFESILNYTIYGPPHGDNADNKENNTDGK